MVCGGDGTVRAVADAMAGSGVPLVLVPCGTGNLLVRNLGLPIRPADALAAGLTGEPHALDLGRIEGDGFPTVHFTAMAGAGLDAAMLEETSDRAKSALGWPAYVLAGARGLRAPRMRLAVRLDGGPELHRTARMVLVANIGTVQAGAAPVPAARPDDGLLDLAVFDPRGVGGWLRAAGVLLSGKSRGGVAAGRPERPAPRPPSAAPWSSTPSAAPNCPSPGHSRARSTGTRWAPADVSPPRSAPAP
nr:diacylglycerol kinase family protein [Streptomyces microflavus]